MNILIDPRVNMEEKALCLVYVRPPQGWRVSGQEGPNCRTEVASENRNLEQGPPDRMRALALPGSSSLRRVIIGTAMEKTSDGSFTPDLLRLEC